jgi:hypothetical protein
MFARRFFKGWISAAKFFASSHFIRNAPKAELKKQAPGWS